MLLQPHCPVAARAVTQSLPKLGVISTLSVKGCRLWLGVAVALSGCADPVTVRGQEPSPVVEDLLGFEFGKGLSLGIAPFDGPNVTTDDLAVQFRQAPGFYDAPFALEVEGVDPKAEIIFTLDGSLPDRSAIEELDAAPSGSGVIRRHTYRYSGPVDLAPWLSRPNQLSLIDTGHAEGERGWLEWRKPTGAISKSVVVRARAIAGDFVSPILSGTFFVDPRGRERHTVPVVSLSTDSAYLFNSRIGIYVLGDDIEAPNFNQTGDDWERPAYFEFFDRAGERAVSQWLGIRVNGNYSRAFPQKSLRLLARKEYGPAKLEYPFFASKPNTEFKRLLLRNGGNDWSEAHFRDSALQSLVQHLPIETQHSQPAVVYINGEYWGLHDVRDRLDEFHLELRYGVPREQITILQTDAKLTQGLASDAEQCREFVDRLLAGDFDTLDAVDEHIAVSEFLDYVILESYAGNTDWPNNNFEYWRYSGPGVSTERGPRDGRWRPLVFDVDRSLGRWDSTDANVVKRAFNKRLDATRLLRGLFGVEQIRHEFIQRLAVHLATTFEPSRVSSVVNQFTRGIEAEMPDQIARWGYPTSMDEFYGYVEESHEFAEVRPENVRRDVESFFDDVTGTATVRIENIDPLHPPTLHSVRLSPETPGVKLECGAWQGKVFAGVPLVLSFDDPAISDAAVVGAAAKNTSGRLEVTLQPNTDVTIRLPTAFNVDVDDY